VRGAAAQKGRHDLDGKVAVLHPASSSSDSRQGRSAASPAPTSGVVVPPRPADRLVVELTDLVERPTSPLGSGGLPDHGRRYRALMMVCAGAPIPVLSVDGRGRACRPAATVSALRASSMMVDAVLVIELR
jgi:hypothetical protein